jgi:cytochrome c oxidase subunit 2
MMPRIVLDLLALPPEASTAARGVDALHVFVISVTMASSTLVAFAAIYFVVRHRQRGSTPALTPRVVSSPVTEGLLITGLLGLFLLWWVIGYRQYVEMQDPPGDALVVYVSAKQWMWKFAYPDGHKSNDVLVVPVGRPVRLVMTSRDVIHSFYVPAFRQKRDVLPGRYVTTWFQATLPGSFPILCAEYCGVSHSLMRGSVNVLSGEDYAAWLRVPSPDASGDGTLAAEGMRVALRRACFACHTVDGQRHIGPTWSGLFGSDVTLRDGRQVVADEAYLTRSMMEPNVDVVNGYKPGMPTYFGVLTQPETAAIVEYIKTLRDAPIPAGVALPDPDGPEAQAPAAPVERGTP